MSLEEVKRKILNDLMTWFKEEEDMMYKMEGIGIDNPDVVKDRFRQILDKHLGKEKEGKKQKKEESNPQD